MLNYVVLASFTDQGLKAIKDTTKRADAAKEIAGKFGVKMNEIYWTQGQYDLVTLCQGQDEAAMAAFGLALSSQGTDACVKGAAALVIDGTLPTLPTRWLTGNDETLNLGGTVVEVTTYEGDRPEYQANGPDRCFHCKDELYSVLGRMTGLDRDVVLVDGTNADDLHDYRPGGRAAVEQGVESPLADVGLIQQAHVPLGGTVSIRADVGGTRDETVIDAWIENDAQYRLMSKEDGLIDLENKVLRAMASFIRRTNLALSRSKRCIT